MTSAQGLDREALKYDGLLLITAAIWGAAFVAQRVGMDYIGPHTFNALRFALGALFLLPLARRRPSPAGAARDLPNWLRPQPALRGGLLAGVVLFSGAALQQVGLVYTTAGKAAFITGLYVIIVPLMGLFLGHRLRWGGWVGAGLATVGLYLLSVTSSFSLAPGDLPVLVGAFCWSVHVLLLGWLSPRASALRLAATQFTVCSLLSFLIALIWESWSLKGILGAAVPLLYGGLVSVGIAYTLQVVAQKKAPPHHAAIILSLETVFAALAGWLILDEVLSARAMLGCALMFAGMLLAQLRS